MVLQKWEYGDSFLYFVFLAYSHVTFITTTFFYNENFILALFVPLNYSTLFFPMNISPSKT